MKCEVKGKERKREGRKNERRQRGEKTVEKNRGRGIEKEIVCREEKNMENGVEKKEAKC